MEAKLIGYDETPINVIASAINELENLKIQEHFGSNCSFEVRDSCPPCFKAVSAWSPSPLKLPGKQPSETSTDFRCDIDACTTGKPEGGTARSHLYEICTANCWKPPLFECCSEEGPSHLKLQVYDILVNADLSILETVCTENLSLNASHTRLLWK